MDFSIEKEELLSVLSTLSKINPSRTTLPILSTVLIKTVGENNLSFRTTDLEIEMEIKAQGKVLEQGETCAPIYKLLEITNAITDEKISININETQRMRINTSTGKYLLMCNKTEEFPEERQTEDPSIKISTEFLKKTIQNTTYACSKDELKPTLNGVLFDIGSTNITAVATDGHRLVKYICKQNNSETTMVLVPQKFLNIISLGAINTKTAKLKIYEHSAMIETETTTISTRLISEKFPDYENVIPKEQTNETTVQTSALLGAVRKTALMSNKTTKGVVLKFNTNKIIVSAEDHETGGSATEEIEASHTGQDLTIGFNSLLLIEILKHQKTDQIKILTAEALSATLFKQTNETETETTTLLMPIRI